MWLKKLTAFIFALFPILWIYKSPLPLVWGDLLLFLLATYGIFQYGFINKGSIPFYILWGYIAITNIFQNLDNLSVTTFVPGGITFFVFAITYLFLCSGVDYDKYIKYYKIIALLSVGFWALQEFMYITAGIRISGLIPFLDIAGELKVNDLISEQIDSDRSSSFFREPAHFVQFLLPILCIDIFEKRNREHFASAFSWIIIVCLLLSRSGNAMVGLALVLPLKAFYLLKNKKKNRIAYALLLIPFAVIGLYYYMVSDIGMEMISRIDEFDRENTSGYFRVIRGYSVFSNLPTLNQWIGISNHSLETWINKGGGVYITGNAAFDMYFNGFQNILIHNGYIGMFLYFVFFISIYRETSFMGKSLIWLILIVSFVANIYLTYCMMICMVVSTIEIKNNENEKNSILYPERLS